MPSGNLGHREGDEDVGSLPRTLSTSVLRIKHRRSFWEKVVGYVIHSDTSGGQSSSDLDL